jgi:cell wall-associated NlpC family hydrolase
VIRAAAYAALSMALAGCAASSLQQHPAPASPSAIAGSAAEQSPARPSPGPRAIIVELATSMLGQPYRFGGAAPGGFDCSGLVAYAANGAGVRVPRTAHEQLHAGTPVARSDLKAGDLVFMHLAHKELHVGIAIDAERFVHAPSKGGLVRIDSLGVPRYARGFITARRIITAP